MMPNLLSNLSLYVVFIEVEFKIISIAILDFFFFLFLIY